MTPTPDTLPQIAITMGDPAGVGPGLCLEGLTGAMATLGHTWKNEPNPNLEDPSFRKLLARGVEWAATGAVTIP